MKVININSRSWTSNCYLLINDGHALVIDPSVSSKEIIKILKDEGATLEGILITHGHFDHILSLDVLKKATNAPIIIHELDAEMLLDGKKNAFYTFFGQNRAYMPADRLLKEGDTVDLGDKQLSVIHTPGHTRGSVCFLVDDMIFTGDTLFSNTYGRCDLFGGDIEKMAESLKKLGEFEPSLTLHAGHGESSTLGEALDIVSRFF